MKVLLHHILETSPHGRAGIDLHLGQKPKLGGRHADDTLIYISYFVSTLYIHVSLSFLCSYFYFPKHKKTKNISFVCLFSFLALVCFTFYFRFDIRKIQKYFALFAVSFRSCFKIWKPKNICCCSSVL
jgi:hypothetical protein